MCNRGECLTYFKQNNGFDRAFALMRRKWESLGRTAGTVRLTRCSEAERRALESLLGRACPGADISFSLPEFEAALAETRFQGVSLKELLELYFDMPLISNKEKQAVKKERLQAFFDRCREEFLAKGQSDEGYLCAASWIGCVAEKKQYGYHTISAEWKKSPEKARKLISLVGKGLCMAAQAEREDGSVLLAVLAAQISGNPHFLDRGTTGGLLFTQALCHRAETAFPSTANEYAALYYENGIQMDDISSTVAAFGIHLERKDGRLHPAYEGFIREKEPYVIMQANLEHVRRAHGAGSRVFIVENEMVFSYLCGQARSHAPLAALVCTSGQPRKAAYQLLDLLAKSGMTLYYAGDLDPDGLRIADHLAERYGDQLLLWHMAEGDYRKAISDEEISQRGMAKMEKLKHPQLRKTAESIRKKRRAGYQERLLPDMVQDILTFGQDILTPTQKNIEELGTLTPEDGGRVLVTRRDTDEA